MEWDLGRFVSSDDTRVVLIWLIRTEDTLRRPSRATSVHTLWVARVGAIRRQMIQYWRLLPPRGGAVNVNIYSKYPHLPICLLLPFIEDGGGIAQSNRMWDGAGNRKYQG